MNPNSRPDLVILYLLWQLRMDGDPGAEQRMRFLTNIGHGDTEIMLEAARDTNTDIQIADAMWPKGTPRTEMIALYGPCGDLSNFWRRVRELRDHIAAPSVAPSWWPQEWAEEGLE